MLFYDLNSEVQQRDAHTALDALEQGRPKRRRRTVRTRCNIMSLSFISRHDCVVAQNMELLSGAEQPVPLTDAPISKRREMRRCRLNGEFTQMSDSDRDVFDERVHWNNDEDEPASRHKRGISWPVCAVCLHGGSLRVCDGDCSRAFHLACIGLSESQVCHLDCVSFVMETTGMMTVVAQRLKQVSSQETVDGIWKCSDCSAGAHRCRICNIAGPIGCGTEAEPVRSDNVSNDGTPTPGHAPASTDTPIIPAKSEPDLKVELKPEFVKHEQCTLDPEANGLVTSHEPTELPATQVSQQVLTRQLAVQDPSWASATPVYKCRVGYCGGYYHLECVESNKLTSASATRNRT